MPEDAPTLPDESRIFIEKLAQSLIWILAIGLRGKPDLRGLDGPARREALAAHRIEVADIGPKDSVVPFNYRQGDQQILPFFSSKDCARQYQSTLPRDGWPFQPHLLRAGFVASPGNEKFDPILDPGFPSERKLQPDEKALLRKITSVKKPSADAPSS